mgnify:CR=1 FL=1
MENEVLGMAAHLIILCCFAGVIGHAAGTGLGYLVTFIIDKVKAAKAKRKETEPETE